jgi:hypothetical protein
MNTNPNYWFEAGKADRKAGNDIPAVTKEDFYREILDSELAEICYLMYMRGFAII